MYFYLELNFFYITVVIAVYFVNNNNCLTTFFFYYIQTAIVGGYDINVIFYTINSSDIKCCNNSIKVYFF